MNEKVAIDIKIQEWSSHIKKALYVLVAFLVIGAAFLAYQRWHSAREEKAFALLFEAERMERDLAEEPAYATPSNPQFYQKMQSWDEAKKNQYKSVLEKVISTFPQSLAGQLARLRLGVVSFQDKQLDIAEKTFLELTKTKNSNLINFQAWNALGVVYEEKQDWQKANESYSAALKIPQNSLKAIAELGQARVLKKLGNKDEALKTLHQVIKDNPNTYYEKLARVALMVE
jgi:tetratricopeptide (TPR) repeat protein